jgi:hypothetical protein
MRRTTLTTVTLVASGFFLACESGPAQTYVAPPANAGAYWNDGRAFPSDGGVPIVPVGTATGSTQPFALPDGGPVTSQVSNAQQICTQQQIAAKTPIIANAPIVPPNSGGNLNLGGETDAGTTSWEGLTVSQAEKINCQGTVITDIFGNSGYLSEYWDNESVIIEYPVSTHKINYLGVFAPYEGLMKFTSLDGTTKYTLGPIDGTTPIAVAQTLPSGEVQNTTLSMDWNGAAAGVPTSVAVFDTLYRAIMATFAPTFPTELPSLTCNQTGACIIGTFAGDAAAYFFIPALGWSMWVYSYYTTVSANAIIREDIDFAQLMNYSGAIPVLKLDSAGTLTVPAQIGKGAAPCQLSLGMHWSDFEANCLLTSPGGATAPANQLEDLEEFAQFQHDEETFSFNIAGIDLSFADSRLVNTPPAGQTANVIWPGAVVVDASDCPTNPTDPACPQGNDPSSEINVDQSTVAIVANDWTFDNGGNPVLHDLHGAGAEYDQYRTLAIQNIQSEICNANPSNPSCSVWAAATTSADIAACVAPRDSNGYLVPNATDPNTGLPAFSPSAFAPANCTGLETLLSADQTTPDDPVNIGPIVMQVAPNYSLGMKMGHQVAAFCTDAMSRAQIASQSFTFVCPGGAQLCDSPTASACPLGAMTCPATANTGFLCPTTLAGVGPNAGDPSYTCDPNASYVPPAAGATAADQLAAQQAAVAACQGSLTCTTLPSGYQPPGVTTGTGFVCPAGTCDPTAGTCATGVPTCTTQPGVATPLTVPQVDFLGEVGPVPFLLNPTNASPAVPAPAGTEVFVTTPQYCVSSNILPLSHTEVLNTVANGNLSALPVDLQDNRFFFKMYGYAVIQTLEATTCVGGPTCPTGATSISAPVAQWGNGFGTLIPISINDLFFDSLGDGQFETMEYVDRRFVCADGASNCAPVGSTDFSCPANTCNPSTQGGLAGCATWAANQNPPLSAPYTCNAAETARPPQDLTMTVDVKDGIMDAYDINQYSYRGETALYDLIQAQGYAPEAASNALLTNIFGSPLLPQLGGFPPGISDLAGIPLNAADYASAFTESGPLTLSFSQSPTSPIVIAQTFEGPTQALVQIPWSGSPSGTLSEVIPWLPNQPGNGYDVAQYGNSTLDSFVQAASVDFTGTSTTALVDYNLVATSATTVGVEELAAESSDFLGDVFLCYEAAANPPLLAVRMYTPTQTVIDWLNSVPSSYSDCQMVVRWSPYENYVNMIESTLYGVRLQTTQGGGLGRVVGAQLYVPNLITTEE